MWVSAGGAGVGDEQGSWEASPPPLLRHPPSARTAWRMYHSPAGADASVDLLLGLPPRG